MMSPDQTLLPDERIKVGVEAESRKEVFDVLAGILKQDVIDHAECFKLLKARENLGSTGLGRGIALPHARCASVTEPKAALVALKAPIDFGAVDGDPVDVFLAVLLPEVDSEPTKWIRDYIDLLRDRAFIELVRTGSTSVQ